MYFPLFALLQPYISIVIPGEIARATFGLDSSRYKSHSFRIGGACHAAEKGYSDAQIRALGCWKSYAFKVYLR